MDSRGQYDNEPLNATPESNSRQEDLRSAPTPFEESAPRVIDTSHLKRDALEKRHMAAYAVGHFSNDLCAAGWFFYLVFYLKYIVKLSAGQAGLAMLSGQFADGIMTPLVGALSDKIKTRIGSRTPWYILGTFIVIPSFLALFLHPFDPIIIQDQDGNFTPTGELIYYLVFPALFNVGWASVQISNMSIVNSLTYSTQRRDQLSNSRNTFTFIANITVLAVALVLFQIITNGIEQYRFLSIIICVIGGLSSFFYLTTIKEPYLVGEAKRLQKEFKMQQSGFHKQEKEQKERQKSILSQNIRAWYDWFKEGQFYVYGFVYMLVRIAVNVIMSVQSIYIIRVLQVERSDTDPTPIPIALTPLISYIVTLGFQLFIQKPMVKKLKNRFLPMLIAILITTAGCVPLLFLEPQFFWGIYICSPVTQIGLAIMMNTSTSLISDVIGKDADSSAFVYGFYSFMDKIANGIAIERAIKLFEDHPTGLRYIMCFLPIICSVGAFALTYLGKILYSDRLAKLSIRGTSKNKNRPLVH